MTLCASTALSVGAGVGTASAQDFWIGQIVMGGWTFCPRSTLPAAGQIMQISQNQALFALYGTTYGGDGRTTFGLPDLRGRTPVQNGAGPGLSNIPLGTKSGSETATLSVLSMPAHSHDIANTVTADLKGSDGAVNSGSVSGSALANQAAAHYASRGALDQVMEAGSVAVTVTSTAANTGGNQAFDIRNPYLAVQYCVVTQGIFPSRS